MQTKDTAQIWDIDKSNFDNLALNFNEIKNACDELDRLLADVNPIQDTEMKTFWNKLDSVHISYDRFEKKLEEFLLQQQKISSLAKIQEVINNLETRINALTISHPKPKL